VLVSVEEVDAAADAGGGAIDEPFIAIVDRAANAARMLLLPPPSTVVERNNGDD